MRGGYGRSGGRGRWPGNGPFRDLPPWERPGWLYGRGSCWYMGYRPGVGYAVPQILTTNDIQLLQNQKDVLEEQIKSLQNSLKNIEKRLSEIQKKD
ncbi:MAG: DUF5320 domain-containing protein [Candidatus Thorarchaeota archaeon]